jgi:hypothetical protein
LLLLATVHVVMVYAVLSKMRILVHVQLIALFKVFNGLQAATPIPEQQCSW